MSPQRREIRSSYIEWAKLRSNARYNLAISDVQHVPLADLHASIADLEISGPGGYGYEPLLQKLSAKSACASGIHRPRAGHLDGESSGHGRAGGAGR